MELCLYAHFDHYNNETYYYLAGDGNCRPDTNIYKFTFRENWYENDYRSWAWDEITNNLTFKTMDKHIIKLIEYGEIVSETIDHWNEVKKRLKLS